MSERVTVFTGSEAAAERVAAFLTERAIDAAPVRKSGPFLAKAGRRGRRFRVQVPREEFEPARAFVAEWRGPERARSRDRARRLGAVFLWSLLLPALWVGAFVGGMSRVPAPDPFLVAGVWVVSLILAARLLGRRFRAETVDRPRFHDRRR